MARSRRRRRKWKLIAALLLLTVGLPALYALYLYATLRLPTGEDREPVRLYSAPFLLTPGLDVEQSRLDARLRHLDYRPVTNAPAKPGEYRRDRDGFDVFVREFLHADGWRPAQLIRVAVDGAQITRIMRLPGQRNVGAVALEPQLLGGMVADARQIREWTPLADIPRPLVDAVLSIEDRRFYDHHGIDPLGILRAAWHNVLASAMVEGGSTITQQLAKNLYYTPRRTFGRKLEEAAAALVLEHKYTKQQILESYLNEIYFGQAGSVAIYGVSEAARRYLGKSVRELTVTDAALLAGIIKGPNTYDPTKDPVRAKKRRDLVLARLREDGKLTDAALRTAVATPIRVAQGAAGAGDAAYFTEFVLSRFEEPPRSRPRHGVRIFTTLDPEWQRIAEAAVKTALARLEARYRQLREPAEPLQAALVAVEPASGAILAMVGGRDFRTGQFNHAVQARRQAGSLFKPFVYLAAFERGMADPADTVTPLTRLADEPISFASGTSRWEPQNYDKTFHGDVTIRTALEQSLNVPAVRMAQTVGVGRVIAMLNGLGIEGPLDENLGLALGTSDVSLLEITGAYAALANQGTFVAPTPLRAVVEERDPHHGDALIVQKLEGTPAVTPQSAYLITALLKGAVEHGTAQSAKALGLTGIVAGKTGTTDEHRDAWFIGYTPSVAAGVWVGFDDGTPLQLTGAQAALPVWVEFMRQVVAADGPDFPVPDRIVARAIDPETDRLATSRCPTVREEVFLAGTEPTEYCEVHGPGLLDRLKRLFQS